MRVEQIVVGRTGLNLDAAKARHRAGVQHVAGVLVLFGARPAKTSLPVLPVPMRMPPIPSALHRGQTQPLLRLQVCDVGVAAVVREC